MLEDALKDDMWTVRWAVVEALAWIKSPSSLEKIIPRLEDENWMVQVAAIRSLVELDGRDAAPYIANLLDDSNSAVSEAAAEALGLLKNPIVIKQLREALSSEDEFVRLSAIQSIYQILESDAAPILLEMLDDPYNHIRWFAIKHLSTQPMPQTLNEIAQLLPDKSGPSWEKYTISDYALQALRIMNTPESTKILKEWARQSERK
jgi:HEAT repeat protein